MDDRRRCIVAVHAHPDDECTKAGAALARYAAAGVRTVLVCCTDGGAGRPDPSGRPLPEVRTGELARAAARLGFAAVYPLGYADSGMTGEVDGAFARVPLSRVVERVAEILVSERADVVITYDAAYASRHPDHQHTLDVARGAFARAAELGWTPRKLYGTRTYSPSKLAAMHGWLTERGLPSPYRDALGAATEDRTTTRIDASGFAATARRALLEYASQIDPDDAWFFTVPVEAIEARCPWDDLELLESRVPVGERAAGVLETDLFAGLD